MMWVLFLLALKSSYWYFDIRSSEIFIPQYLWPFQDWEGIILINAIILILKLLFTYVAFSRSIYNSKVIYRHQCNFSWSNQIIITRSKGDKFAILSWNGYMSASDFSTKMLPGFTEWCWGKYDGVQKIYWEIEERIEIYSWQSSHWWKWSAAWTNWFEVFYMSLFVFHWIIVCHQHIITLCSYISRSTGKQIQSLIGSIYKAESTAAGINHLSSFFIVLVILQLNLELDLPRIGYAQPSDCSFYILL